MSRPLLALVLAGVSTTTALSQDASYERFGSGCAGSAGVPVLDAVEDILPRIGETFTARFSDLPLSASPFGLIGLLGTSRTHWAGLPLPLDLSFLGITGCTFYVSALRTDLLFVDGASGSAGWTIHIDNDSSLIGLQFFTQGLVLDPGVNPAGFTLTNAAAAVIGANAGPEATIIFPTKVAATDAKSIIVRGTATDPSGIAAVRVNGRMASSGDGFATWQLQLPLARGFTDIAVTTRDRLGFVNTDAAHARIESRGVMASPSRVALDPIRHRVLVTDPVLQAVLSIDLCTGHRDVLSSAATGVGAGPEFSSLGAIALDLPRNRALVVAGFAIMSVDLLTGNRRILSDDSTGTGPRLGGGLAIDGTHAIMLSGLLEFGKLLEVDLLSGDRRVISDGTIGQGELWHFPTAVALDGGRVIVLDARVTLISGHVLPAAIYAVDRATGDRTKLSGQFLGAGLSFSFPSTIVVDGSRALVADLGLGAILVVDLATGDRVIVSGSSRGSGPELRSPGGFVIDGDRAIVADSRAGGILAVDLMSGDRSNVSVRTRVGSGTGFVGTAGIVLDGDRALTIGGGRVVAIDLMTGHRTTISDQRSGIGTGIGFTSPSAIALDGDRAIVTNVTSSSPVMVVDLATGDRKILSGRDHGTGPTISRAEGIVIDGTRALVTTSRSDAVLSMDLVTGDRRVVSEYGVMGSGPAFLPRAIATDGTRAFVNEVAMGSIMAVDLQSGDRTTLASASLGSGPGFAYGGSIAMDGTQLFVPGFASILTMNLDTGDRRVVSGDRSEVPGDTLGSGPRLKFPKGIAVQGSIIYVADASHRAVLAIDRVTGDRVILSQ